MKNLVIKLLQLFHLLIVLFVVFGSLAPDPLTLKIHLAVIPLLMVQWFLNDGTCYLTNLENMIRGTSIEKKSQQQGQFIKKILGLFFQTMPTDSQVKIGLYAILVISWSISFSRL